jgi:hypothetical protein
MLTGISRKEPHFQPDQVMLVHLAIRAQPPFNLSSFSQESRCAAMVHYHSICQYQVQRMFLSWLLMSSDAPQIPTKKFKFSSWAQMIHFQAMIAEIFGFDKLEGHPHNAKLRKKRHSIVVQFQKQCRPIPMVSRAEVQVCETIPERRIGVLVGLILRRPQIHRSPDNYLFQTRRLLLLNQDVTLRRRECIRLLVSNEDCGLLPDRPRWMQTPSEPTWPGKCRVRAGAEPAGYDGRLWSRTQLFRGEKKSSAAETLPRYVLKRRLSRRVTNLLFNAKGSGEREV